MNFIFGMLGGIILGATIMHFVHEYLDDLIHDDNDHWLSRLCPPCDGKCQQGRDCPAKDKK